MKGLAELGTSVWPRLKGGAVGVCWLHKCPVSWLPTGKPKMLQMPCEAIPRESDCTSTTKRSRESWSVRELLQAISLVIKSGHNSWGLFVQLMMFLTYYFSLSDRGKKKTHNYSNKKPQITTMDTSCFEVKALWRLAFFFFKPFVRGQCPWLCVQEQLPLQSQGFGPPSSSEISYAVHWLQVYLTDGFWKVFRAAGSCCWVFLFLPRKIQLMSVQHNLLALPE